MVQESEHMHAHLNRGPAGRPPRFLIWPKKSGPKSPVNFLKPLPDLTDTGVGGAALVGRRRWRASYAPPTAFRLSLKVVPLVVASQAIVLSSQTAR